MSHSRDNSRPLGLVFVPVSHQGAHMELPRLTVEDPRLPVRVCADGELGPFLPLSPRPYVVSESTKLGIPFTIMPAGAVSALTLLGVSASREGTSTLKNG
jgi:hypothetical protein